MDPLQWAWLVWLGLAIAFAVVEMFTLDFTFAMLSAGSFLGGVLTALLGGDWWLQIVLAAVIALLLIFLLRPPLLRWVRGRGSTIRHNVDAIAGLAGVIETAESDVPGTVKLANGETWSAKSESGAALSPGERVRVVRVVGAIVEVAPAPEQEPASDAPQSNEKES